jgi:polyhydroxybutyrate depolymerase
MRKTSLLFLFLFLFSFCSKDDDQPPVEKIFSIDTSFSHDSQNRTFRIHLPPGYYETSGKLPLVVGLHGGFGSGEQFEAQSELSEKADAENFIVVYPDGLINPNTANVRSWNAGKCCAQNATTLNTDDVGFISKLIDKMITEYRVDNKKVYVTGHSNGAMMTYRLVNELSDKIAAAAPNAGNFQIESAYAPARNVPILQVISKLDENVLYDGGYGNGPAGQYNPPIDSCLNVVAARAGCTQAKQVVQSSPLFTQYKWSGCSPETFEVLLYLTEDGGHSWPGGNKGHDNADEPSQAFVNNDIIWEFFKKYSLP